MSHHQTLNGCSGIGRIYKSVYKIIPNIMDSKTPQSHPPAEMLNTAQMISTATFWHIRVSKFQTLLLHIQACGTIAIGSLMSHTSSQWRFTRASMNGTVRKKAYMLPHPCLAISEHRSPAPYVVLRVGIKLSPIDVENCWNKS